MHGWMILLGLLAVIALVLMAFGIILGMVKPADAAKHVGAVLGIVIVLMLIPGILASAWSGMSPWQQIALIAIVTGAFSWRMSRRRTRNMKEK
jgi:asparagine N-glycosylation enzyme membrane subunit Stt3